jgi:hypothetical protein
MNKTDKVTKITNESILNALFFSDSRLAQLALKEIANGKVIMCGDFSDQDEYEERLLCEEGIQTLKNENINVIHSEAGY